MIVVMVVVMVVVMGVSFALSWLHTGTVICFEGSIIAYRYPNIWYYIGYIFLE